MTPNDEIYAKPETRLVLCRCGHESRWAGTWHDVILDEGAEYTLWSIDAEEPRCPTCGASLGTAGNDHHRDDGSPRPKTFFTTGGIRHYAAPMRDRA